MKYLNPVIKGFYPDPSLIVKDKKLFLVTSSCHYFPAVPLFESDDMVNWRQIGNVLNRESQVDLKDATHFDGVFAPTLRYHDGRFYMTTTNFKTKENFYVYTDDIYGSWSDPIIVDQDGIDPSLFFEDGHCYFLSNGTDDQGEHGIVQCEIDIATGKKLSTAKVIWKGSGGRYIESPHTYKINGLYYLMVAEGGTEYGHMITIARSKDIWGPYVGNPANPILTNRNKGEFVIQGAGHGELFQYTDGNWYLMCLAFRQLSKADMFHNLGREVHLLPVSFNEEGWPVCGYDGTLDYEYELPGSFAQLPLSDLNFTNTSFDLDWVKLRKAQNENYQYQDGVLKLLGNDDDLSSGKAPVFIGLRQKEFKMHVRVDAKGNGGLSAYMCDDEHFDLYLKDQQVILEYTLAGIHHQQAVCQLNDDHATLFIDADHQYYYFSYQSAGQKEKLGQIRAKYLSSEVSGGFTGVVVGLFASKNACVEFTNFNCHYE